MSDPTPSPDSTPRIPPALTEAEWATFAASRGRLDVEILKNLFDGRPHITIAFRIRNGDEVFSFEHEQRHALAALCLYGQSFGFTQADVVNLRSHSESVRQATGWTEHWADNLADRIESLLPTASP